MVISNIGLINGILVLSLLFIGVILGIYLIYLAKKTNAGPLLYVGILIILIGLVSLGSSLDFFTILFTGNNTDAYSLVVILTFMWFPLIFILTIYLGAEILLPDKKFYLFIISYILGLLFGLFVFLNPMFSLTIDKPSKSGTDLANGRIIIGSLLFFIIVIFIIFILVLNGFGYLYKSFKSKGIIKQKYFFLSIGTLLICLFITIESITYLVTLGIILRIALMGSLFFWYLGLRVEPEIKRLKRVKINDGFFALFRYKKDDITAEEIANSKEMKICLVCKRDVLKFDIFLCGCGTYYCKKCTQALLTLENMCWACDAPLDELKPMTPFKIEDKTKYLTHKIRYLPDKSKYLKDKSKNLKDRYK